MASILLRSVPDGASELLESRQLEAKELLQLILLELRKMNIQLQIITDEEEIDSC